MDVAGCSKQPWRTVESQLAWDRWSSLPRCMNIILRSISPIALCILRSIAFHYIVSCTNCNAIRYIISYLIYYSTSYIITYVIHVYMAGMHPTVAIDNVHHSIMHSIQINPWLNHQPGLLVKFLLVVQGGLPASSRVDFDGIQCRYNVKTMVANCLGIKEKTIAKRIAAAKEFHCKILRHECLTGLNIAGICILIIPYLQRPSLSIVSGGIRQKYLYHDSNPFRSWVPSQVFVRIVRYTKYPQREVGYGEIYILTDPFYANCPCFWRIPSWSFTLHGFVPSHSELGSQSKRLSPHWSGESWHSLGPKLVSRCYHVIYG